MALFSYPKDLLTHQKPPHDTKGAECRESNALNTGRTRGDRFSGF
jgi:hypothetical protein